MPLTSALLFPSKYMKKYFLTTLAHLMIFSAGIQVFYTSAL